MSIVNRKSNRIPSSATILPWGTAASFQIGGDSVPMNAINLATAELKMTIQLQNATSPVTIIAPAISWISQYTVTISYKIGEGKAKNVMYTGQPGRGDAGYLYTIWTRSAPNTAMQTFPEVLSARTVSGTLTEETIPMMFLLDAAATERWCPIQQITFVLSFKQLNQIMFAPNSPNFNAFVNNYWFEFDSGSITPKMPKELCIPDPRKTFINLASIPVGTISIPAVPLVIPGKPLAVFYYMLSAKPATLTSPPTYNLNPNPFSIVTFHQILVAGHPFPINSSYFSVYDATGNNTGTSSHYKELLSNINKYLPDKNTIITYDNWLNVNRVYSILINDTAIFNATTMPLQIGLNTATVNPCDLIVITQYLPTH
jgi:hypothetical protein